MVRTLGGGLLAAAMLAGCLHLPPPPGFVVDKHEVRSVYPSSTSAEARYALLQWYLNRHSGVHLDKSLARRIEVVREEAVAEINRRQAAGLAALSQGLIYADAHGGIRFNPAVLATSTDWKENFQLLQQLRLAFGQDYSMTIPEQECQELFRQFARGDGEPFQQWAAEKQFQLLVPQKFNRQEVLGSLDKIQEVLTLKRRVLNTLLEAKGLQEAGNTLQALNLLDEMSNGLNAGTSLALIGDSLTLVTFENTRRQLPLNSIDMVLYRLTMAQTDEEKRQALGGIGGREENGTLPALQKIEQEFSDQLRVWHQDLRFADALQQKQSEIAALTFRLQELRIKIWSGRLAALATAGEYWDAAQFYRSCQLRLAEQSAGAFYCYYSSKGGDPQEKNRGQLIEERLLAAYHAILPDAAALFLAQAEKASGIANRHGVSFLFCTMLQRMLDLAGDPARWPASLADRATACRALAERSLWLLEKHTLSRQLSLRDISSDAPGLGTTYARDLENELRNMLQRQGLGRFISMTEPDSAVTQGDYMLLGGRIADYDGNERIERTTMRSVTRYSPGRKLRNPDYRPEATPQQGVRFTAAHLYEQDELKQVINVKEIERLAHVRIFFNIKGPGVGGLIELNEFYSKKFVVESSHLVNDVYTVQTLTVYQESDLQLPGDPPPLLNERVWSTGEMLDFARLDSLRILSGKVLYHLLKFPLFLAERAERLGKEGELQEATEFWGGTLAVCDNLPADIQIESSQKFEQPPAAKCYEADMRRLQARNRELQELKSTVQARAFAQANDHLRQLSQAARP